MLPMRATAETMEERLSLEKLPELGYAYAALEPHIDAKTMEIHLTKHHAAYIEKFNAAVTANPALRGTAIEQLLSTLPTV